MSIATLPPVKHYNKKDYLKCNLLKKIRKNFILIKYKKEYILKFKNKKEKPYTFDNLKFALSRYHMEMKYNMSERIKNILIIRHAKRIQKINLKDTIQILP